MEAGAPKITPKMLQAAVEVIAWDYGVLGPAEAEGLARDVFIAMSAAEKLVLSSPNGETGPQNQG